MPRRPLFQVQGELVELEQSGEAGPEEGGGYRGKFSRGRSHCELSDGPDRAVGTIVITEDGLSAWPFRTVACLGFDFYLEEIASGDIS